MTHRVQPRSDLDVGTAFTPAEARERAKDIRVWYERHPHDDARVLRMREAATLDMYAKMVEEL